MNTRADAHRLYVVDRIEGDGERLAVLVPDQGAAVEVPVRQLPRGCAEGDVLRVPVRGGAPVWGEAVRDAAEKARRLADARERLGRLRKGDPGGDLVL
ncbi:MAG: DUF3006 family protein [Gemmatimonadetes bacterium]|nr:DUF3006 family protein [Gemmatimonadota bacterium]